MTKPTKTLLVAIAATLVVAWLGLFVSSRGLLVWGSGPEGDRKVGMLKCQYFTGTGITERQFLYSEQGFLGRDTCPRFVNLK